MADYGGSGESLSPTPGNVANKFYIRVNNDLVYASNGTYKSLKELHTLNSVLYPKYNLDKYIHPVLKAIGNNPNAYKQIYSYYYNKFVNDDVEFPFDDLEDGVKPIVENRLYMPEQVWIRIEGETKADGDSIFKEFTTNKKFEYSNTFTYQGDEAFISDDYEDINYGKTSDFHYEMNINSTGAINLSGNKTIYLDEYVTVDFPMMNPYMVEILDYFAPSSSSMSKVELEDGDYTFNRYGCTNNTSLRNVGIIEIQGAGGGSGGTNNVNSDCAGGGGGGGGYALIYYRIKNTNANVNMTIKNGIGGTAGGAGSGYGGSGGYSAVYFDFNFLEDNKKVYISVTCEGGAGGETGNYNYTNGGNGGSVTFAGSIGNAELPNETLADGGLGGTSSRSPSSGTIANGRVLFSSDEIVLYLLAAQGGAGGGRGDDTDGSCLGQAGTGTKEMSYKLPYSKGKARTITLTARSGGSRGSNVSGSAPGGGGASVLANGSNGGTTSTSGNAGTLGSGAGGACCGNNANRPGSKGGDGIINLYI